MSTISIHFLMRVHHQVLNSIEALRFDGTHPWHRSLTQLYATTIEYASAIIALISSGCTIAVPSVLRSSIEAHLDFVNLAKDRRYGYRLELTRLEEYSKFVENALKGTNPFTSALAPSELQENLHMVKGKVQFLKHEKGARRLSPKIKFELADELDSYDTLYWILCCEAHNDGVALSIRHAEQSADGAGPAIALYKPMDSERIDVYIHCVCRILIADAEVLFKTLGMAIPESIDTLKLEHESLIERNDRTIEASVNLTRDVPKSRSSHEAGSNSAAS